MTTFKIATWNVNSLRVRLPQVLTLLEQEQPDLLALQETKLIDSLFPTAELAACGYRCAYHGQKAYNGVATLSRVDIDVVRTGIEQYTDPQCRVLQTRHGQANLALLNLYVPNGERVDSEKYQYKLGWMDHLQAMVKRLLTEPARLVIVGDFNVAPEDRDVYDPEKWRGSVLVSEPERQRFQALLELGLVDTWRERGPTGESGYTWWDYRRPGAFARDRGLRIDHILCPPRLLEQLQSIRVCREVRGWERPSDHAPVIAEFGLP